jgi:transposase
LARPARIDPQLLSPVQHRSAKAQLHLTVIRARCRTGECSNCALECRTRIAEVVWRTVAQVWHAASQSGNAAGLSAELREALEPLLREVESLNERVKEYDRRIEQLAKKDYPKVAIFQQAKAVGELISLTCILAIEDPRRFQKSRDVFSCCGLGGGTLGKASHRCTSARKGIAICERCSRRARTTFWAFWGGQRSAALETEARGAMREKR